MTRPVVKMTDEYFGDARGFLIEDDLTKEEAAPYSYPILDGDGQAYTLMVDSEVKVDMYEGKLVHANFFRIASFPRVHMEDTKWIPGLEEYAISQGLQAIKKQEDVKLVELLLAAVKEYDDPDHTVTIGKANHFDQVDFDQIVAVIKLCEITPRYVWCNPLNAADFESMRFNGYVISSVVVPAGVAFVLPYKEYLGVLPTLFGVSVNINNNTEMFYRGWVADELIGMMVLNPAAIGILRQEEA